MSKDYCELKKTRCPKLRSLVLFYVWEDARAWAHWNHSFDVHLSYLGLCVFTSRVSSGLIVGSGCYLMTARWLLSDDCQFSSVAQSCPTLWDPVNHGRPGLPVHHQLPEFFKLISIESVMPSSHLILCHPLLLLPPISSSIRVFSNESTLCMRWSKYWSFSFSISPSN